MARKFDSAPFIAWDGEGYTTSRGHHRYWIVGNSLGEELEDRAGLRTFRALPWLASRVGAHPDALHVAFSFSYDVNMMLRNLPRVTLASVHAGQWTHIGAVRLKYQPRKALHLSMDVQDDDGEWVTRGGIIWDVFGFFQSSFVAALKSYGILSAPELAAMAEMKAARRTFSWEYREDVRAYMRRELAALTSLMDRVREYVRDAGLALQRWDGAGSVAASLLKREGVQEHKGTSPDRVLHGARRAYFGGRIEALRYGHTERSVYQYDVRSAYPAALARCPSLSGATWREDAPGIGDDFALARVRWHFTAGNVFPFPWRARSGAIYYPPFGEGWVWWPEVDAARSLLAAGIIAGRFDVLESWACDPATDAKPFGFVPQLYAQRAEWKREGRGAEKMLKLGLNSLYGKTAQHVGGREGQPPTWHQIEWSGYTTSATRAALLRASLPALADGSCIMFATDAVFTERPLLLPDGGLGTWEGERHDGLTVVQSGVYWTGPMDGGKEKIRGFDPGSLDRAGIVRAWRRGALSVRGRSHRFVGMGRALAGARSWALWGSWPLERRELALHPLPTFGQKRHALPRRDVGTLWDTRPTDPHWHRLAGGPESAPLAFPWAPELGAVPRPTDDGTEEYPE